MTLDGWMGVPAVLARVLVAACNDAVREGLEALLASLPDLSVTGVASDAAEAIRTAHVTQPDVVLLDLPEKDARSVMEALKRTAPRARTLVLADSSMQKAILRGCGADAVLVKGGPISRIAELVRDLHPRAEAQVGPTSRQARCSREQN